MSLLKKSIFHKLSSLIFIILLLTNITFLFVNIESTLASPGLTLKWYRNLGSYSKTYVGAVASDLNGDGILEVIVTGGTVDGGYNGTVTALNGNTGATIWRYNSAHSSVGIGMHSPAEIADIDKDGIKEIVVSGHWPVVLRADGTLYWRNTAVLSYNLYSPVADIDGDGFYEIFCSSGQGPWEGDDYFRVLSYDGKYYARTMKVGIHAGEA